MPRACRAGRGGARREWRLAVWPPSPWGRDLWGGGAWGGAGLGERGGAGRAAVRRLSPARSVHWLWWLEEGDDRCGRDGDADVSARARPPGV